MAGPVIITRAAPGNDETAGRLSQAGVPFICAPMLTLTPTGAALPSLEGVQGLLFTSANGVRAFCEASARRDLTAWCVGPATLKAAQLAGFTACEHGDGNSEDLADLVIAKARTDAGKLIHVANAAAAGQLAQRLGGAGFGVEFTPLYAANRVKTLPFEAEKALGGEACCVVLVHSAKGAEAFGSASRHLDMARHTLVAVSQAAGLPLRARSFSQTLSADRPNEAALMDALFRAYSIL